MKSKLENENIERFREIAGDAIPETMIMWLAENGYFKAPASRKHHSNYPGGLFDHSEEVAKSLCVLTKELGLEWSRPESPIIVGLLHDVCKMDLYRFRYDEKEDNGCRVEYNNKRLLNGHGEVSVMLVQQHIAEMHDMKLTEEEMMCIRYHMGAFTDGKEWPYYSRAIQTYPNVLYTHTADMIASQISCK